ncbi:MAG: DUF4296 domain-containing protein [Bacteroidales bacterium]|jgi:Ran GTPase-activating protein (RanGAP) involved in mRNA processing and transport|nr:DUF4296 domain-containing protein [Bacteroidales bacterium]
MKNRNKTGIGISLLAMLLVLLAGCHKNQKLDKPDNLISRNIMLEIMTDGYILEAMVYLAPPDTDKGHYCEYLYAQMFDKYNVDKDAFVASLTYYLSEKDMATHFLQDAAEVMTKRRDLYYTEMHDIFEADSIRRLSDTISIQDEIPVNTKQR